MEREPLTYSGVAFLRLAPLLILCFSFRLALVSASFMILARSFGLSSLRPLDAKKPRQDRENRCKSTFIFTNDDSYLFCITIYRREQHCKRLHRKFIRSKEISSLRILWNFIKVPFTF